MSALAKAKKVDKDWGYEIWMANNEKENYCGKILYIKFGHSTFRMAVHVRSYESVGEGTAQYARVLSANVLIHFLFADACDIEFSEFNHQNVINAIVVTPVTTTEPANLRVEVESIWGFGGVLRCSSVEVEAVEVLPNVNV